LTEIATRNAPPWLVSAAIHLGILVVLAVLVVGLPSGRRILLDMAIDDTYAEQLGEQLDFNSPLQSDTSNVEIAPVLSQSELPEVADPLAVPEMLEFASDGTFASSELIANQIGLALTGREEGAKAALLGRYGGTKKTEEAVMAGLGWLARNQTQSGAWSLTGPYADGAPKDLDNQVAATAMALLAFQGAGITPVGGSPAKFRSNVAKGWSWLLKQQDRDGNFYHLGLRNHRFYTQGQCTIALCELYGMTKAPQYREPAELAVQYCLKTQSPEGGWRYEPGGGSDVSVTGWIVMALQSARMAGVRVPQENLDRIGLFLDSVAERNGSRYRYRKSEGVRLSMTAEGLLCRQYLGWHRNDPRLVEGVEWITADENLIDYVKNHDVYYWYYATQVAHHMEGDSWERWNGVMRQVVPSQQVKQGRERGSWAPNQPTTAKFSLHGGRLYVTCLSIHMLEVYYRHLPIYTKVYGIY